MRNFQLFSADGSTIKSDKTLVMGILNATPDSFSDGGELSDEKTIEKRVESMISAGADILDVGGESTRPGHTKVSADEELIRLLPVIKSIRKVSKTIPISVDTQKAAVAEAALEASASFINDVSALSDKDMSSVINKYDCSIVLMRNEPTGSDLVEGCRKQFEKIVSFAKSQGIKKDRVLLDPGLGFGDLKTGDYKSLPGSDYKANLLLILKLQDYSFGMPVVIGASRKRFIAEMTGEESAKDRLAGSVALAVIAKQAGAGIVRVHDVAETISAFKRLP